MDANERATMGKALRIGQAIQQALDTPPAPENPAGTSSQNYAVTKQGGCVGCDPASRVRSAACPECGYLFTGEAIVIQHQTRGKRVLSDKGLHYLLHGMASYHTGYLVRGELVTVTLDLDELAPFVDLIFPVSLG